MKQHFWPCVGIGVRMSTLYPFINNKKCYDILKKRFPEQVIDDFDEEFFDIDEFCCELSLYGLAEFLCMLDDTNTLSWNENGSIESFCYYVPTYPWNRKSNEPVSKTEVHERIVDVLILVTDLTRNEAGMLIDDNINEVGSSY